MNKGKGIGSTLLSLLILILIIGFGISFFQANGINSSKSFFSFVRHKSDETGKCYNKELADNDHCSLDHTDDSGNPRNKDNENAINSQSATLSDSQLGYSGPTKGQPFLDNSIKKTKASFEGTLKGINVSDGKKESFSMTDWPHYVSSSSNPCWSTKNAILYAEKAGNITLLDSYRKETTDVTKACSIKSGTWIDTYTGKQLSENDVNLDYIVPLQYANNHGGKSWNNAKKQEFANDTDNAAVVSISSMADRNGQSPAKWEPKDTNSACVFSKKFIVVAHKYGLTITANDKAKLDTAIQACAK